ncbi:MAG: hypothetical protein H0V22_00690 [Solirubrobacterales bacterium]|nr:hypothetical protein [Solirubrobacterales bacterium]
MTASPDDKQVTPESQAYERVQAERRSNPKPFQAEAPPVLPDRGYDLNDEVQYQGDIGDVPPDEARLNGIVATTQWWGYALGSRFRVAAGTLQDRPATGAVSVVRVPRAGDPPAASPIMIVLDGAPGLRVVAVDARTGNIKLTDATGTAHSLALASGKLS